MKNASQHTAKRAVTAVAGMALATAMFGAGTASAVTNVTCTGSNTAGSTKTCTLTNTNNSSTAERQFVVPAKVHAVHLQVVGAWGGDSGSKLGGKPMEVNTDFMVGPSEVLFLYAGGAGGDGGTGTFGNPGVGGFNGGAAGGDYGNRGTGGGGGGGASDVRVSIDALKNREVVAAGGGGAGVSGNGGNHDASAGGGTNGGHSGNGGLLNSPFTGGSQSGVFGLGGVGKTTTSSNTSGGGGGGGGYGGGGGGNSGSSAYGGGGGSSFYRYKKWSVPGKTAPSTDATSTSGGGKVVLTYKVPA